MDRESLKKLWGVGESKNCEVQEVEKIAECGRLEKLWIAIG